MSNILKLVTPSHCESYFIMSLCSLKGSDQWEKRGVWRLANERYWPRTVLIDVLLSFDLAAIL
jgi:hypothetical protein